MTTYTSRAALNAAVFPFAAQLAGRTVMNPQLDIGGRQPQSFFGAPENAELSAPQLLYCQDVMPTAEGLQSVGYETKVPATAHLDFDQAITLRDENENNFLFVPAAGKNYVLSMVTGEWTSTTPITGWTGKLITRAYVNGQTYICYEGMGVYQYDAATNAFVHQTLVGLTDAEVRGIGSSSNYLIAYTNLEVHWSSLINPLDFAPSLATGAGYAIPQDVKARITAVLGISGGFIIYTAKNAIAAVYTNNTRAPFTFKEIANAGGIQTYEQVTSEQTSGAQYAWTTGGLQKITVQSAEPVSGAVNDFIAGKMWDEWDSVSKRFITGYSSNYEFPVKLSFISSRYLVMSYSVNDDNETYQWALVFDTVLKRWGKLKIDHTDCFSYPYPNVIGPVTYADLANTTYNDLSQTSYADMDTGVISDPPSKVTVAFLQADGTVKLLIMDYNKETDQKGVVIFGKFQLRRSKLFQLQTMEFEGVYSPAADLPHPLTVTVLGSLRGYTQDFAHPAFLLEGDTKHVRYAKRATAMNLSIAAEGTFALSTLIIEGTEDGDR